MENKIQELTNKLYSEGLSKGKAEAEQIKATAQEEANRLVNNAKTEAEQIIAAAKKEASELKSKIENDVKMAAKQTIASIKQDVENSVVTKAIKTPLKESISDKEFLAEVILTLAKAFNPEKAEPTALEVVLPQSMQEQFGKILVQNINKALNVGINVEYSKEISNGFKIGPQNESYKISFTENDFEALFAEYLRPDSRKLIFG